LPRTPEELEAWNKDARIAALQGAWVVPSPRMQALAIEGTSVRVFDEHGERAATLVLRSPCELELAPGIATYSFTLVDGRALFAGGSMGTRHGRDAVVCAAGGQYVLHRGRCRFHRPGTWRGTRCRVGKAGFTYDDPEYGTVTIAVDGNAIMDEFTHRGRARPVADFATAMAIVQAYFDATDLAKIAAGAGGRVGHSETVADVAASVAADPKGWRGRVIAVHGVIRSHELWGDQCFTITDASDGDAHVGSFPTAPRVLCFTARRIKRQDGDRVVAVGTVTKWGVGAIALHDCVLSR
jgi:hypothetical protein